MKKLLFVSIISIFSTLLSSQDQHFTQFFSAPLSLNPALTGAYDGTYRFSGIYRDQWRNALDNPYTTFAGMLDVRFPLNIYSGKYKDAVAIGLMFYNDKVSGVDFNTNQIAVSAAYHKSLSTDNTQYLSIGFQGGLGQRNINYEDLTFNDSFNGTSGFFNPTRENLPANNFSFDDYAVGINYSLKVTKRSSFFAGVSLHHIFEPQMTFYPTDTEDNYVGSTLYRKYGVQLSGNFPISEKVILMPRIVGSVQGPHVAANIGSNFRISVSEYDGTAVYVGGWARPVQNFDDQISVDAAILMVGLEYKNILFGLSYDATLVDIQTDRNGQGAFEFSVAYLGNFDNESLLCPKF